jgi:methionine-rich copper-binding protein CopC
VCFVGEPGDHVALVTLILAWAPSAPASAHVELISSDPPDGELIEAMPSRAFLTFSDTIAEVHEVAVVAPDGSVTNGPTYGGTEVRQTLWAGPDGAYTMQYQVVSSDGHDISGEVDFEVGALSTTDDDATTEAGAVGAALPKDGSSEVGPDAALPVVLVLLGAAVALGLLRRQRAGRSGDS